MVSYPALLEKDPLAALNSPTLKAELDRWKTLDFSLDMEDGSGKHESSRDNSAGRRSRTNSQPGPQGSSNVSTTAFRRKVQRFSNHGLSRLTTHYYSHNSQPRVVLPPLPLPMSCILPLSTTSKFRVSFLQILQDFRCHHRIRISIRLSHTQLARGNSNKVLIPLPRRHYSRLTLAFLPKLCIFKT